jgi:SET domain-containing protein
MRVTFRRAIENMNHSQTNKLLFVTRSPIHGRGLFAAVPLTAGQLIGVYEGPEVTEDGTHVLWIQDDTANSWTGYNGKNDLRFLNHSDTPNAEMDELNCYALCDIEPGTEITIDYGWNKS